MTAAGPELVAPGGLPVTPHTRLAWLDALRGIAVLAVVVQHGGELVSPGFARFTHGTAQLGQAGVLLFFLVSGFVIPLALDRGPSLRRFVLTRVMRLYPAYVGSILAVFVLWHVQVLQVPLAFRHHARPWLANLTMLQTALGQPNLQGQYWSLIFELTFYAASGVLLALGLHRRSVPLAGLAMLGAVGLHAVARATGHAAPLGLGDVATMFVGSVLFRVHSGAISARTGWRIFAVGVLATQAVLAIRLAGHSAVGRADASTGTALTWLPLAVAWAGAYAVFGVSFAVRARVVPWRWLVLVGEVSYSIYLLHPLAFDLVGRLHPAALDVAAWIPASVALGWIGWRLMETPGGRLGRKLADLGRFH